MTPEDWQRLKPLFDRAADLPPAEQAAFLEDLHRQDPELADRLAALLAAHEQSTESVERPLFRFDAGFDGDKLLFSPGELILDRFRIVRFVGRGGMGEVYEAEDVDLGRVALKTIRAAIAADPRMLQRFKQEVALARKVTSPYVCRIHELHLREPAVFLTMEFLEGVTLSHAIEQAGVLPLDQAQAIALQLCAAVQAMHDAGIIHRDFKSNNVMLVPRHGATQAVLMDLGLARETERAEAAAAGSAMTTPGTVMGTSEYMAPEQFEDRPLTPAADIYALGVVLYELATGTRPFHASTPLAAAVRRARRLPPATTLRADLPPHWDAVIARCLEYDPEKRYQSATEVAAALEAAQPRRTSVRPRLAILAAIVIAAASLAALFWYRSRAYPPPSRAVQKWYRDGVAALREGSYLKATRALERAVRLDPNYALAHVRLADAWAELDFTSKAQQEMLEASGLEAAHRLSATDKQYLDAVRQTLTGQFAAAVQDYTAILRDLPTPEEKAYGLVDLGRAHEKAGQISDARQDYAQAATLASEDPAPFIHLGVIESRAGQKTEADAAFDRAETLYRSASNNEGLAEIAYQRGIAARTQSDYPKARTLFTQCLNAARDLDSPQLQIRTLTQLGTTEYAADNYVKALELYGQAIDLASAGGLSGWATEGLIRSGLVYTDQQDLAKAATIIQKGLQRAEELQSPRLEALAHISLANVRDQQSGPPSERFALAQQAYDYYKTTGSLVQTTSALTLMVRALGDKGDYLTALSFSSLNIDIARKTASPVHIAQAEESAGGLALKWQNYPEALTHFQAALSTARQIGQFVAYEASNCANVLWHLGRYSEAHQMLASIPPADRKTREITVLIVRINAGMILSERRFQEALTLAQHLLKTSKELTPAETMELENVSGLAQAELGAAPQARQSCQSALDLAEKQNDRYQAAEARVCAANAALAAGAPHEARPLADTAQQFFAASQQKESEWQSLLALSQACDQSGDPALTKKYAQKALDIFTNLANNWGNTPYQSYVSRPDIHQARQKLLNLVRK